MPEWTVSQLREATQGTLLVGRGSEPVAGIGIDSRRLQPRQAFVAIRGPRFDGHAFLKAAIDRGASCVIVSDRPASVPTVPTILVPDTTNALGDLAAFHRRRFSIPVIAVTGSCGKTTTKELIAHLLGGTASVLKTVGTENNHIGVPLTLLRLMPTHQYAVVELGSNHPGEIAALARIAQPTVAVITNVGPAHLEFFGTLSAIRQEKLSLLALLDPQGAAIIPGDQLEVLLEAKSRLRQGMTPPPARAAAGGTFEERWPSGPRAGGGVTLLTFGSSDQCGIHLEETRREARGVSLRLHGVPGTFTVPLLGSHNVENALAALACVSVLGIPLDSVRDRLRQVATVTMRSEVVRCNGFTVINDCYNANPLSFARALELLSELEVTRRVVIAGDMLELGSFAVRAHQTIGQLAAQSGTDLLLTVGRLAHEMARGALAARDLSAETYETVHDLLAVLPSRLRKGDGILVKASRNVHLEQVTTFLQGIAHA
ncbi:MAG: UDP-N-acetylmuramoyl-tripeptide--D-alanyl-D-alanine ligase [Candidatus Omnitrophica bacterium]|nr:UDP-N-acetylmuramoyl-tripeptide--D-alanyl-D-alanine ligase [Candidatus Omnitrophota bacterium]